MLSSAVSSNSRLFLGSKIVVESDGNLVLAPSASIVSATLDARFDEADASIGVQKDRIDTLLAGTSLDSDTLKEVFDFANAVKSLEISDVSSLLAKTEILRVNDRTVCEVEPGLDIVADSSIAIKIHATDSYKGWWIDKYSDDNAKVNLYFPIPSGLKVGDISSLYFKAKLLRTSFPFITVYTQIDTSSPNSASWYKSKRSWDSDSFFGTILQNTRYMGHVCLKPSAFVAADSIATVKELLQSPIPSSSAGSFNDSEAVFLIACSTNSSDKGVSGPGLILGEFGIVTKTAHVAYQCSSGITLSSNTNAAVAKYAAIAAARDSAIETQLDNLYQFLLGTPRTTTPVRESFSVGLGSL